MIIYLLVFSANSEMTGCISTLVHEINIKKIIFGNKEHTTDKKMGVSVLLRLYISNNEVFNTANAL